VSLLLTDQDDVLGGMTEPASNYVLRTSGISNADGTGIGLLLLDEQRNSILSSCSIYLPHARTSLEADHSAILLGMEYAKKALDNPSNLKLECHNDIVVYQVNRDISVTKGSLQMLLDKQERATDDFDSFAAIEVGSITNAEAVELAKKALKSNSSTIRRAEWDFQDPLKDFVEEASAYESLGFQDEYLDDSKDDDSEPSEESIQDETEKSNDRVNIDKSATYLLRFDGGCRNNPGPIGAGMVLYDPEGYEIWTGFKFDKGVYTNNVAEYLGLLCGVQQARFMGIQRLVAEGDSMLVVKQLNGEYRVKHEGLKHYYNAVVDHVEHLDYFEIRHVPRKENARADELANMAMDTGTTEGFDESMSLGL